MYSDTPSKLDFIHIEQDSDKHKHLEVIFLVFYAISLTLFFVSYFKW